MTIKECQPTVIVTLTTAARHSDALVHSATAVHHSHANTPVVVRHRLRKGRVAKVWTSVSAAIVVVPVEAAIFTVAWVALG